MPPAASALADLRPSTAQRWVLTGGNIQVFMLMLDILSQSQVSLAGLLFQSELRQRLQQFQRVTSTKQGRLYVQPLQPEWLKPTHDLLLTSFAEDLGNTKLSR